MTVRLLSSPDSSIDLPVTDPDVGPPLFPSSAFVMSGDQWFGQLWAYMSQDSWLSEAERKGNEERMCETE